MSRTDTPHPTQAEIDAAITGAHKLRSEEFGRQFAALSRVIKSLFSGHRAPTGASHAQ